MTKSTITDHIRSIERRSAALRAAAAAVIPSAPVPSCPEWAVFDLVAHVGAVQRFWAAAIASGRLDGPPTAAELGGREPVGELLAWSKASTRALVSALGPTTAEQGCWAWWAGSGVPLTVGAVARHQVQEVAVHAVDAQLAAGAPAAVPVEVALDGLAEFVELSYGVAGEWPHPPAAVAFEPVDGQAITAVLHSEGARAAAGAASCDAQLVGTASDLLLVLHRRLPTSAVAVRGDPALVTRLLEWPYLG